MRLHIAEICPNLIVFIFHDGVSVSDWDMKVVYNLAATGEL